jgi:Ca-activated chloride channel family protein
MSFQTPIALLALLLVPLAVAVYLLAQRRRPRYAVRFSAAQALAAVAPSPGWRRHVPAALTALALALALISLARPEATVAVPVERASVMLVTDGSGSMRATDVAPSRLEAARDAASGFLDDVPDELQAGFVGFSNGPHTVLPPTEDREQVRTALEALTADGGTSTGDALRAALDALPEPEGDGDRPPGAIVLLSDGRRTAGSDPLDVAREAAQRQVPVYTVSLGTAAGTLDTPSGRMNVPPDPETMRRIAQLTGGQAFTTADAGELSEIYDELGSRIGTREEQREVTAAFAGGALLLFGLGIGASLRRFGRIV